VRNQITDGLRLPIGAASSVVRRYPTTLTDDPKRQAQIMRGAVVGGSGAVNGGYFCRGLPSDFDGWGISGWTWADVLPHFRAIENDLDFDTPVHGSDGPILVRRVSDFDGCTASFVRSATEAGFDWIGDLNGGTSVDSSPGVGAVPLNINGGTRVGPGGAYLQPAVNRTNLTLLTNTRVRRVRIVNAKAVGLDCVGFDGTVDLTADRIVLCAGAISSAHLLMLSGIGPHRMLRSAGVPVVVDLPVGASFVDHPEWVLPVDWSASHGLPPLEAVLTTADGLEIRPYTAGFGAMVSGRRDDPADRPHIGVTLMQPKSRGVLALTSADPDVPPLIDHHYDSEPDDVAALNDGADLARELASPTTDVGPVSWSTSQHLSSTAPMGVGEGAVLDPQCRVRGIDRLWVVDGSVLPIITSRGPHATVVMIGHRAAEFVS
jgi:predicted dehydrogenase (TIGR03970 family)